MKIAKFLLFGALSISPFALGNDALSGFDRFYCEETGIKGECVLYRASILNLIATPERFHGKRVRVIAYLSMGYEETVLFYTKDSSYQEAVWLSIGDKPLETEADVDSYKRKERKIKAELNNRYVLVEGEFDMQVNSRLVYRGAIKNISRIEKFASKQKARKN